MLNLLHIKARVGGEGGGGVLGADPVLRRAATLMAISSCLGGMCVPVGKVSTSLHTSTAVEAISAPFPLPARWVWVLWSGSGRICWLRSLTGLLSQQPALGLCTGR